MIGYGMQNRLGLAPTLIEQPQMDPAAMGMADPVSPAPAAFQWGAAGQRMTPEDIAARRASAQRMAATGMDFSPVGSWTQGLARVAQALLARDETKKLDRASAANAAESNAAIGSLGTTGDSAQSIAGILASPYVNDGVKEAAKLQWQASHKAVAQPTEFERAVQAAGIQPGTPQYQSIMLNYATNKANPMQAVPGVDDQGNQVLRFIRPTLGGGDPASASPGGSAAPPSTLPPDFDFGAGGPTQPASATFR